MLLRTENVQVVRFFSTETNVTYSQFHEIRFGLISVFSIFLLNNYILLKIVRFKKVITQFNFVCLLFFTILLANI